MPIQRAQAARAGERALTGNHFLGLSTSGFRRRVKPDWASLACEIKRPGVNLTVLWEEYRDAHTDGYGYSRFCDLVREF